MAKKEIDLESIMMYSFSQEGLTSWGYGEPSAVTRQLVAEDLVELEFKTDEPNLWRGKLTESGKKKRAKY